MLSTADLNLVRSTINKVLTETATILRRATQNDGAGNAIAVYSALALTTCRVRYTSDKPSFPVLPSGEKAEPQQLYIVTVPYDVVLQETDILKVSSTGFEIVTQIGHRSWNVAQRFQCKINYSYTLSDENNWDVPMWDAALFG